MFSCAQARNNAKFVHTFPITITQERDDDALLFKLVDGCTLDTVEKMLLCGNKYLSNPRIVHHKAVEILVRKHVVVLAELVMNPENSGPLRLTLDSKTGQQVMKVKRNRPRKDAHNPTKDIEKLLD